jgi:acetyl esterase/lipase
LEAPAVLKKLSSKVIVVTASADPLRDSGLQYYEKLGDAGVDREHVMLKGSHSFSIR